MIHNKKEWRKDDENHVSLYFTPFHREEKIATITQTNDNRFLLTSELLNTVDKPISKTESIEAAKANVEEQIGEHYADEIQYNKYLFKCFTGKDVT